MTEKEIRLLIGKSQKDGFKALFQQYQKYVYSIIWRRIRNIGTVEDAEECMSDVFTHVFIHFDDINDGSLQAYIATVATRTAINKFNMLSAKGETSAIDDEIKEIPSDIDIADDFEIAERNRIIYDKICSLGEPDSTLIIQKYYYERKSKDIAKMVGLSPVAVRVRLNRALKRLKQILTDENILSK